MADHPNTAAWRWVPVEPTPEMRMAYHAVVETTVLGAAGSRWAAMLAAAPAPSLPPVRLPEPAAFRTRYRSEPGMLGNYPWHYEDRLFWHGLRPEFEREPLYTADQLRAAVEDDRRARGES